MCGACQHQSQIHYHCSSVIHCCLTTYSTCTCIHRLYSKMWKLFPFEVAPEKLERETVGLAFVDTKAQRSVQARSYWKIKHKSSHLSDRQRSSHSTRPLLASLTSSYPLYTHANTALTSLCVAHQEGLIKEVQRGKRKEKLKPHKHSITLTFA